MIKRIKSLLFENRHAKQTIIKNTFWLSIGTVASRVVKAAIIIYAARLLGTEDYGIFSYALSLAALFSLLADVGMTAILTREVSKSPELLEKNLSAAFVVKLIFISISMILVGVVGPMLSTIKAAAPLLPLAALLIAFDALREFGFSVTRAKEKMEVEAGINIVTGVGITVLGFVALFISRTAYSLMIGYITGSGLGFILAFLLLSKHLRHFWNSFSLDLAKNILKEALPFALLGLLGALTVNTDTLMIGWLKGASDVGLYSAALRIVLLIYLIPTLLAAATFPLLSKLARRDDARVRSIMEKIIPMSLLMAMPIALGGAILAQPIIHLLFGPLYVQTALTFAVLLSTVLINFPAAIINNSIFSYNRQRILIVAMLIGGVGNVIFDYLFIPHFGILGSSFATVISQTLAYGFAWQQLKTINNFHTFKHLKKGVLAALLMGIACFGLQAIHVPVLANIVIAALVYLGALIALREKLIKEVQSVFSIGTEA